MYLFTRQNTCKPERLFEAGAFAVEITERIRTITGVEVRAWAVDYGAPLNTVSWTLTVESQAELGAFRDKLFADAGYMEQVQSASELFANAPEDSLTQVLGTTGDGGHTGSIASVVTARCAPGRIAEAMTWGAGIMEHVASLTGQDALFGRSLYGPWATLGWISLAETLAEVDTAVEAMAADAAYLESVDGAADLFLPGSGHQVLSHRLI